MHLRRTRSPHPSRHTSPAALALLCLLALSGAVTALAAQAGGADALLGTWLTEPGDKGGRAYVEIRHEGDEYVGRIVRLEAPNFPPGDPQAGQPKTDRENPDHKLRDRPIVGMTILDGFRYDGDGKWTGGTIYDPSNGKTYKAQITRHGSDQLAIRGYVGIPLFGRTTEWERVK